MDIAILANELATDALGVGYASMSDAEAADALNTPNRAGKKAVPASDVRMFVLLNGLWPAIQAVAAGSSDALHKGTAITILQTLGAGSFDSIRMNRPEIAAGVAQMLTTMVEAGAITEAHRDAMVAMGDATISRAEELGLGAVHHLNVAEARG
jgi:hypothetical protein